MPLKAHREGTPAAHAAAELHEGHQQRVALPGVVSSKPIRLDGNLCAEDVELML